MPTRRRIWNGPAPGGPIDRVQARLHVMVDVGLQPAGTLVERFLPGVQLPLAGVGDPIALVRRTLPCVGDPIAVLVTTAQHLPPVWSLQ